ncbi:MULTISPECIES: DUF397 domain-containing protein [Streptomyces]|uniref:DUF397 domain-containing protein n=1 Tax=Streptomyces TaxID=1883 RepID=UPI00069B7228|nr:DUF397 domain-containing protein [Streptomyces sp. SID7805]MYU50953.1 DUF397 domain-containing protein [Streptomyces sp. SID7805]
MIVKPSAGDAAEPAWFKSSYSSGPEIDSCVEVAATPATIHVRDSKNAQGPSLRFAPNAWADFVTYAARV